MNIVLIIPTGIGCSIGGHAGDANPVSVLIGKCCDKLILHPNVVNASDVNEMPENALYIEGSILDRFLRGEINLKEVKNNKILVAVSPPLKPETVNAVSSARITLGIDAEIVVLKESLKMEAKILDNGSAGGDVYGWESLCEQVEKYDYDALAIVSPITVSKEVAWLYLRNPVGANPWGFVEAKLSKLVANSLNKPVAHAPIDSGVMKDFNEIVDPRLAPECISLCYLHCVLKGLKKSPMIGGKFSVDDVDMMISPDGCFGEPHKACLKKNIPILVVRENKSIFPPLKNENLIYVENYWEAAGYIMALNSGIHPSSVRRPFSFTTVNTF